MKYGHNLPIKLQIFSKYENKSDPTVSATEMFRTFWFPFMDLSIKSSKQI